MTTWGAANRNFNCGVQAGEVLLAARTHLNDDEGIIWPDQKLFPKLREAHRTMQLALVMNGVPVVSEISSVLQVPSCTTDLSTVQNYPTNIVFPTWMKERMPGQRDQDFVDMTEVDYLPQMNPSTELIWWCWSKQTITFIGCLQNREVLLRYRGGLKVPQEATDPIGPFWGELYLSYKTAALAVGSVTISGNPMTQRDMNRLQYLEMQAAANLDNLLSAAAQEAQNLPTKRRPYHRGRGRSRVLRDF